MATIARLAGEGIGPFKKFDFDFSDETGNPHPGPHIFAGINGSGKSTILRTLAWLFEAKIADGFPWQEWQHLIQGYDCTRAMVLLILPGVQPFVVAQTTDIAGGWQERLLGWVRSLLAGGKLESVKGELRGQQEFLWPPSDIKTSGGPSLRGRQQMAYLRVGALEEPKSWSGRVLAAGYGPGRLLKHLSEVNLSVRLKSFRDNCFSFETTVQNEAVQSWLLGLFSKRAIAKERGESMSKYSTTLGRFEQALSLMCGENIGFSVDIEPALQPRLLMYHKRLDFSQLPDGVRSTVGWLADFLMRIDMSDWMPESERGYVLFLDEVDSHLHPRWQRSILPSIKQALPEVQIFATSHSPFVIGSCPGARVHVLDLDMEGVATNRPPEDAPVGESILATMKDIFGVSSRFDVDTEKLLGEWNQLRRAQEAGSISPQDKTKLMKLAQELSSRSEELRQIVLPRVEISDSLIASLKSEAEPAQHSSKRK